MKILRKWLCALMVAMLVLTMSHSVDAASATKVKGNYIWSGDKGYWQLKGYTSKGKRVWTYNTPAGWLAESFAGSYIVNGSYVYIVCTDTSYRGYYIRLKKSNGKVIKKVKSKYIYGESALGVYKGNLYVAHAYGSEIYRFNKNGKKTGKFTYSSYYQYPEGRMTVKKNSIKVYFSGVSEDPMWKTFKNLKFK